MHPNMAIMTALVLTSAALSAQAAPPLQAIDTLNVPRYTGQWYEVAKYPNRFQKQCVSDTVAEYRALAQRQLQVINRCRTDSGQMQQAEALAKQVGESTSAKLKVRFAPAWLSFLPMVWGDYWVIDIDEAYQLAAVSEPQREYLWILSRTPAVEPARYAALLTRLQAMGLDTSKLQTTSHTSR